MSARMRGVIDISAEMLCEHGIRGVLLDLDNTIVAWGEEIVSDRMRKWIYDGRTQGLQFCLLSNSYTNRAMRIAEELQIPAVAPAFKPLPFGYIRAMLRLGTTIEDTIVIGDQVFTDILGARMLNMRAICVAPLSNTDFWATRLTRCLERIVWK